MIPSIQVPSEILVSSFYSEYIKDNSYGNISLELNKALTKARAVFLIPHSDFY